MGVCKYLILFKCQRYDGEGHKNWELCTLPISDILHCQLRQQTNKQTFIRSCNVFGNAVAYIGATYQENGNSETI